MKFQIGDKVIILHSGEEAEIIEFINAKMALVEVGGVQFPVHLDQIDFPYFQRFSQKKPVSKNKETKKVEDIKPEKSSVKYKVGEGVWLAFLPVYDKDVFDDDIVDYFRLYLINQTETAFNFKYWLRYIGHTDFELTNNIASLSDFYLHDISFESFNDSPRFDFEFSLSQKLKTKVPFFEVSLKLKAKQIFKKIEEIKMKQEASFFEILFEQYPDAVPEEKTDLQKLYNAGFKVYENGKLQSKQYSPIRTVVDLHIDKLTDKWKHLSNFQILDLQLKTFEKYYDLALQNHQPHLIIVHGVGTGKLRNEIHEILKNKVEVKSFVNQFHPSFGFGATEIFFK